MSEGTVYWVTGLSGSGKTTIGEKLAAKLRHTQHVIFLDGDTLREVFGEMFGHSTEQRFKASMYYARLCRMLAQQGASVVCATISMFDTTRAWNRENITHYKEIYIQVPLAELEKRDSKAIYSRAKAGELTNVVGVDIEAQTPKHPDIIIDNYGDMTPEQAVETILHAH